MNDILIRVLWLNIGFIFSVGTVSAQKALLIFDDEDKPHLVSETGSQNYFYGPNSREKVNIDHSRTSLVDYPHFVPGFVFVESQKLTLITYSDFDGLQSDYYQAEVRVVVKPNRDIKNAYLIALWKKSESDHLKIACAIGNLKAGQKKSLKYYLKVHKSYDKSTYRLFFMTGGVEIASSEKAVPGHGWSPLKEYQLENGLMLIDGGPKPFYMVHPKHVLYRELLKRDAAKFDTSVGETIQVIASIDENGYVADMEFEEKQMNDNLLAEYALETIRLWKFKPRIKNGVTVESKIMIPFALDYGKRRK